MTPPKALHHALLRPPILQILRATGFHSARPAVIDSITDLAARYLELLCEHTSRHMADNNVLVASDRDHDRDHDADELQYHHFSHTGGSHVGTKLGMREVPTIVDVRMALQDLGALLPERDAEEQEFVGKEDDRGVEDFVAWAKGPRCREIKRIALDGVDDEVSDYLAVLKQKTAEDSKFTGTLLGTDNAHGVVHVEGGNGIDSIDAWMVRQRGHLHDASYHDSRPPSSGLSSIGTMPDDMSLT